MASSPDRFAAEGSGPRGRGRPVDHDGRETRAAILVAAQHQFGRAGYDGVSMEGIAAECHVNVRALYHHFASKRALFDAAREAAFGQLAEVSRELVNPQVTARDRFEGYVEVYRVMHAEEPHLLPFIGMALVDGMAVAAHHGALSEAGAELRRSIEVLIDEASAAGEIHPDLNRDGVFQLLSALSIGMAIMSLGDPAAYPAMLDAAEHVFDGDFFTAPKTWTLRRSSDRDADRAARPMTSDP